jgi:2-keto-4-pentenoate hydratase/2-oxohepta-3-ene-1,7-dioic acid hydratase in catechol pathway
MMALIEAGPQALNLARELVKHPEKNAVRAMNSLKLAAPIPRPQKLRGFSVFERHLRQSAEGAARKMSAGATHPEVAYQQIRTELGLDKIPGPGWKVTPGYYLMDHTVVVGHDSTVHWPAYSNWIDYELELVAVIGQSGKDIAQKNASAHIFGYTIVNDLSARDAQLKAMATALGPAKGKDFDGANPMGPCIVTADEISDPYALTVKVRVNGKVWSSADGREAQFRFDQCIAYASQSQTLGAGEMLTTGTYPDCSSIELGLAVQPGDVIEFEVEKIGVLKTRIAPASGV